MKTLLKHNSFAFLILAGLLFFSCQKEVSAPTYKVDPSDPDNLTDVLIIPNSTIVAGDIPTESPASPVPPPFVGENQNTASVTQGSQFYIPFSYEIPAGTSGIIDHFYLQVKGAKKHIIVKNTNRNPLSGKGTVAIPVGLPPYAHFGGFCMQYGFTFLSATNPGVPTHTISMNTCFDIKQAKSCADNEVSGEEGLTYTEHVLGSNSGLATIEFDTYSVPDRIDVYYNGNWVAGTGSDPGPVPPQKDCGQTVTGDGFIGDAGTLSFAYDPNISKKVTVVVSGCLNNGTAWNYRINCP